MSKKALIIGIDDYPAPNGLNGCVNDAVEISSVLEKNGDGSPNFDVRRLLSSEEKITSELFFDELTKLFSGDAETVVLFFAGHGIINDETNAGFLVTQDGKKPNWGISLADILNLANGAYPKIQSTVIILDSCQSGLAGEIPGLAKSGDVSVIGNGVTILTACHRTGTASEINGQGMFTSIMLDALTGAASDVIGRVTPASLYAHVDQTLGAWEQRPVYKANVQKFITLRQVPPKVPLDVLRRLLGYFPDPADVFGLDPSFEPERGEETDRLVNIPIDEQNVRVYQELQLCNRNGLVVPHEQPHMWHAAIYSTGCRLTATGAHYRKLAELGRI